MKKQIQIVETDGGRSVATIPVAIACVNYIPSVKAFEDEAWDAAVEDGVVSAADRQKYIFIEHSPQEA